MSRTALLALSCYFLFAHGIVNIPSIDSQDLQGVSEYRLKTSVTWKHVASADRTLPDFKPPISVVLLLDAVSAFIERDYIRSILYAAMSIETVALSVLDETYTKMKAEGDSKGMLRIISYGGRNRTMKDPVYEHLAKTANFKQRLHEQSLYMLGRSLLVENESLYQEALKLYNTRNKIVHMGELPYEGKGDLFYPKREDALKSIECATKVFGWFGISDACVIPANKETIVWGSAPLKESDLENYEDDSFYPWSDD